VVKGGNASANIELIKFHSLVCNYSWDYGRKAGFICSCQGGLGGSTEKFRLGHNTQIPNHSPKTPIIPSELA